MTNTISSLSRLCVHTITTKPWPIEISIEKFAAAGVGGISVWREALEGREIKVTGQNIRDAGLEVIALVRGGFFPSVNKEYRVKAVNNNKKAIKEASDLGAPMVVLVCGADPDQSLQESRNQIREGIETILPMVVDHGIKLAIEPLHPMYADTRSAITTMQQANELAEYFNSDHVGVAVDVYHLWWDPTLEEEIIRCGKHDNLFAFHICDWLSPTEDMLNDRGLMGEGCIPVKQIRGWVEKAGFKGYNEVEIFSTRFWSGDQDTFLENIIKAYKKDS
ncbi:sugar phosphate isomerase/epimerase family protein [Bacteroidota bacterium]